MKSKRFHYLPEKNNVVIASKLCFNPENPICLENNLQLRNCKQKGKLTVLRKNFITRNEMSDELFQTFNNIRFI